MAYNVIIKDDSPVWNDIKKLSKKYRHIKQDFLSSIAKLEQEKIPNPKKYPGFCGYILKVRISSRDMKRGKRGSLRLIYYKDPQRKEIYPLILYPKSDKENIIRKKIVKRIEKLGLSIQ